MNDQSAETRIVGLERRLRRMELILIFALVAVGGRWLLQDWGWLPVRGSSLEIRDGGRPMLDVRRALDNTLLLLHGADNQQEFAVILGGPMPDLSLTHSRAGGSVKLAAGRDRSMLVVSGASEGRRLFLGAGPQGPEIEVIDRDGAKPRRPSMPE